MNRHKIHKCFVVIKGGENRKAQIYILCDYQWETRYCSDLNNFVLQISKFFFFLILFIYLWLCWVFVSVRGLSLVAVSGGHSSSRCAGLSLSRPLLLWSTGSRCAGSAIVAHGPSRSAACGIFPDQDRTRVPCIGRQILNHCATRAVQDL